MRQQSKASRIRVMLNQGTPPKEIAATLNTTLQNVYSVKYLTKKKADAKKAKAKELASTASVRISPITGKPVRAYKRRKPKQKRAQVVHKPFFIDVPVPQPVGHFSFWQRLRILFLGRASK